MRQWQEDIALTTQFWWGQTEPIAVQERDNYLYTGQKSVPGARGVVVFVTAGSRDVVAIAGSMQGGLAR